MRIVSLLPSSTEILFAIGAGADVVGVTHECDYPPAARALPQLTTSSIAHDGTAADIDRHVRKGLHEGSGLYALDSAQLDALQPDLIVTQELCAVCAVNYETVARAAKRLTSDPRIVSLEPSSLADVYATIAALGEVAGRANEAATLIDGLRAREAHLRAETERMTRAGERRPRALVLEWTDPPMSGGHWTPELVALAGGEPLLGNPGTNSTVIDWETIALADPDVVIVAPCGFDLAATRRAIGELADDPTWQNLRAHREREVYLIDGNAYLNRPGPRLLDTAEIFATIFYEDAVDVTVLDPHAWETLHP
jgi:iron complex transport system substrate-binding protein